MGGGTIILGGIYMSDIVQLLKDERERLTSSWEESYEKYRIIFDELGKKEYLDSDQRFYSIRINYDNLSPSQKFQYDYWGNNSTDKMAKLEVYESFIKSFVDPEIIKANEKGRVEPPKDYLNETMVSCNDIEVDIENHNKEIYSIKVGPIDVRCPKRKMSFEEYKKIYTTSLYQLLSNELKGDFSNEEIKQNIKEACTRDYIDSISKSNSLF